MHHQSYKFGGSSGICQRVLVLREDDKKDVKVDNLEVARRVNHKEENNAIDFEKLWKLRTEEPTFRRNDEFSEHRRREC